MKNQIDIILTAEQVAAGQAAVTAVAAAFPYLISLTPIVRTKMLKMGERSEGFVRTALEAATQHPAVIPETLDMTKLNRDLALRENLAGTELALGSLLQKVQDTRRVAGADLYSGALDIYQALQRHGTGEGVDLAVNLLRQRFRRIPAEVPPTTEPPVTPPPAGA